MQRPTLAPHQVIGFGHLPCSRFRCEDEPQLSQLGGMVQRLVILAERHTARAHARAVWSRNSGSSRGALKDMILKALNEGGGGAYLMRQANENPAAFMTLLGRVLRLQVAR